MLVGKEGSQRQLALAEAVEPHGFCVACMLHCHEGHEVYELYSKLDFRCDCGNNKMPFSCQIDGSMGPAAETPVQPTTNQMMLSTGTSNQRASNVETLIVQQELVATDDGGKSHTNTDNVYNQTFFDIYCICKKPHEAELIDNYMIQCFHCEDWFHNQHLLPPMLTKQLDDDFILICRSCLPKIGTVSQILPYVSFMEPACRKAFTMCYKAEV